ncbi:hypothetical protein HJFPF1_04127 [Paramyrothecium foliicola]|nr:hypothetical protein HJFPF1_04127 [Paramyrothecium foliicola]
MLLLWRNKIATFVLLARFVSTSPQEGPPETGPIPSASQVVVTATTGDNPVVTFRPSQDPAYTNITETITTTNQHNHTIIVLPLGIIWAPVPPVPPVPPEPPINTIPDVPDGDGDGPCTSFSMTECSVTVSYTSGSSSWTTTQTDDCTQLPTGCEITFVGGTTTQSPEPTPQAEITSLPVEDGFISDPELTKDDPFDSDWFTDMFKRLGIAANEGIPDPVCQESDLDAPQREGDGEPDVTSSIEEWCDEMDGEKVAKGPDGVDTAFKRWTYYHQSFWLSANYWYQSPFDCGDEATISHKECVNVLTNVMTSCDPTSGFTHGAAGAGNCIHYNITLASGMDDASPPWNPLASPQCNGDDSEVHSKFIDALSEVFCEAADDNDDDHFSKILTNHDLEGRTTTNNAVVDEEARIELRKRSPPASPNSYNGWEFEFTWDAAEDSGDCRIDCKDAYSRLSRSCGRGGAWDNGMRYEGSMDAGCGTWKYKIDAPPDPSDDDVTATKPSSPAKCYKAKAADKCITFDAQPWIAHEKSDTFCDDHGDYSMYHSWEGYEDSSRDFMKDIGWYWKVLWKSDCHDADVTNRNLGQPLEDFSCKEAMRMAFDGCTDNKGRGGMVEVGCVEYHFNPTSRSTFGNLASECVRPWQGFEGE